MSRTVHLDWQGNEIDPPNETVYTAREKPTNADRIRGMTDEGLAHLLHTVEERLFTGELWTYKQWRKWLKATIEEGEQDG